MELELKILKEKVLEDEQKSGIGSLYDDDKSSHQHISLLKTKYAQMKRDFDRTINELQKQSLKVKIESIQTLNTNYHASPRSPTTNNRHLRCRPPNFLHSLLLIAASRSRFEPTQPESIHKIIIASIGHIIVSRIIQALQEM